MQQIVTRSLNLNISLQTSRESILLSKKPYIPVLSSLDNPPSTHLFSLPDSTPTALAMASYSTFTQISRLYLF